MVGLSDRRILRLLGKYIPSLWGCNTSGIHCCLRTLNNGRDGRVYLTGRSKQSSGGIKRNVMVKLFESFKLAVGPLERIYSAITEWTSLLTGFVPRRNPESLRRVGKCTNWGFGDYNLRDNSYRRGVRAVRTCSNERWDHRADWISILSIQGRKGRASSGGCRLMEAI